MSQQIRLRDLLVNRSCLTNDFCVAGVPVQRMSTHYPALRDALFNPKRLKANWGSYLYNDIQKASIQGGGYTEPKSLIALANSIRREGLKEPITVRSLRTHGKNITSAEIIGGHHRVVIADLLGFDTIPALPIEWNVFKKKSISKVVVAYSQVPKTESLRDSQSYNPFPGFRPIRAGMDRLKMIYEEIIDCKGTHLGDIGCNDGYFGVYLSQSNFLPIFIDRSKAYLSVVTRKMACFNSDYSMLPGDIANLLLGKDFMFDVSLYLDVFYHTVLEKGKEEAFKHLDVILSRTKECVIFAPGRWDKMGGITPSLLFNFIRSHHSIKSIKYLGADNDKGYHRDIYSIRF